MHSISFPAFTVLYRTRLSFEHPPRHMCFNYYENIIHAVHKDNPPGKTYRYVYDKDPNFCIFQLSNQLLSLVGFPGFHPS